MKQWLNELFLFYITNIQNYPEIGYMGKKLPVSIIIKKIKNTRLDEGFVNLLYNSSKHVEIESDNSDDQF